MGSAELAPFIGFAGENSIRPAARVGPPPLVGWRLTVFAHPHLQNQLIRRQHRQELGVWYADDFVIAEAGVGVRARQPSKLTHTINAAFRKEFSSHAKKWQEDTAFLSSLEDIALHPSYQRIIGMGRDALPLIFKDLQKSPNHWFWALYFITGENPVPAAAEGNMQAMAEAWLAWGKERGLVD